MKTQLLLKQALVILISLCSFTYINAADDHGGHDHAGHDRHSNTEHETIVSPNGGRVVTSVEPYFEFWLRPDRTAQVTFIDDAGKPVLVSDQKLSLVGGKRSAPINIKFIQQGEVLISETVLPEIKNMPIVLHIEVGPDSKKVYEKFYLNLSNCGSCSYREYACICGH